MATTINADNGVTSGSAGLKSTADASGVLELQTNGTGAVFVNDDGRVGINSDSSSTTSTMFIVAGASRLTAASSLYQFRADATPNVANTGVVGFGSTYQLPSTGTFSSSYQFYAGQLSSAGATLTNNYGIYLANQLVASTNLYGVYVAQQTSASTNIYGVYSNIASGTNRYNFYANGTADNYFAGTTTFANGTTVILDATNGGAQTFNSSGTWTKPNFGTWVRIQMWGGGGGGSRSATTANIGAGGGGGYFEFTVPIAEMGATATVTVGAAGVGRTASAGVGTNGGNSAVTLGNGKIVYVSGGLGATNNNQGAPGGYGGIVFTTTAVSDPSTGFGSGATSTVVAGDGYSYTGGGGGTATNNAGGKGGWGGAGGTRGTPTTNTSIFGGDGGTATVAGNQPGGGGGASSAINTNATNGGAGRVIITTF